MLASGCAPPPPSSRVSRPRGRPRLRRAAPLASALLVLVATAPSAEAAAGGRPRQLIVKLRSEGAHAVERCAEALHRSGAGFRDATADRSDSLDRLHARLRVRGVSALFPVAGGGGLEARREAQRRHLAGALARRGFAAPEQPLPDLAHVYRVELAGDADLDEAIAGYAADAHVAYVQRDHTHALDVLPDDSFLHSSGAWGQAYEDLWGLHRIRAPEAWEISQGEGVVVAVVDTGLDYLHPDIAGNVFVHPGEDLDGNGRIDATDWNGIDDDGNGFVDDLRGFDFASSVDADGDGRYDGPDDVSDADPFDEAGHGTHVAGTIAAVAGNGIGVAGVAPRARIMPLKGFGGPSAPDSLLWRAVLYAIDNGADVVNNSWSCFPACPENPLAEDVAAIARAMDVVIVTSAGNRQSDVIGNSPENGRDVITVASSGQDDALSRTFSNFGWLVDVVAPGGGPAIDPNVYIPRRNILSLAASSVPPEPFIVEPGYRRLAGTSMSAPHVSGVVALLRSAQPGLGYEEIRRILRRSAADIGPPGHDRETGAGRLDALAALTHPPLPDLEAELLAPAQRAVLRPRTGSVEIVGTAAGSDLLHYSLHYGRGNDPSEWMAITHVSDRPVREASLGTWRIADLEQGSYVIRLQVSGRDGVLYSEFLQLSLESVAFEALTPVGWPIAAPSVSGDLVAWSAERVPGDPTSRSEDENVFVTDLRSGREHAIAVGPGRQSRPTISHGVVGWLDRRHGQDTQEVYGCRLDRSRGRCPNVRLAPGTRVAFPPAAAAGRIYWLEGLALRACALGRRAAGCQAVDTGVAPAGRGFLRGDGRSLVWTLGGVRQRLGSCVVDWRTGRCEERMAEPEILPLSRPAVSGHRLAWVEASRRQGDPLLICALDPSSGACPTLIVQRDVGDDTPALSGSRLVWDQALGDEASDVFFCEHDPVRERCPVQRLTAHLAAQSQSAIDGDRVVWVDERDGPGRLYGVRLPGLAPMRDRQVAVGAPIRIPVLARDPEGGALTLAVEEAGGAALETLGVHLVQRPGRRGRASGLLLWRPAPEHVGDHVFTFAATTETGLVTRHSVRVRVVAPQPRPAGWRWRAGLRAGAGAPR